MKRTAQCRRFPHAVGERRAPAFPGVRTCPILKIQSRHARFFQRRYVGQGIDSTTPGDAQSAKLSTAHCRHCDGGVQKGHVHMSAQEIRDRLRLAFVTNVRSSLERSRRSSPSTCAAVPAPGDAKLTDVPRARRRANTSDDIQNPFPFSRGAIQVSLAWAAPNSTTRLPPFLARADCTQRIIASAVPSQ